MVRTIKKPNDIVDSIFDYDEKAVMIKLLIGYQRSGTDWDVYFKKTDHELLNKWRRIMLECRRSGFLNPKVENSELKWRVIMSRDNELNDQCTACPESFTGGGCAGNLTTNQRRERMFVPCWNRKPEPIDDVPF
jgi:hypothetical protein